MGFIWLNMGFDMFYTVVIYEACFQLVMGFISLLNYICWLYFMRAGTEQEARVTSTAIIPGIQAFPVFDAVRQTEHKKIPSTGFNPSTAFVWWLFCCFGTDARQDKTFYFFVCCCSVLLAIILKSCRLFFFKLAAYNPHMFSVIFVARSLLCL